ncbi:MAG: hypothetical protein RSF40_01530 [Oscillospiraceae bacterium]
MKKISIKDIMALANDSALNNIQIYNMTEEKTVYMGDYDECPSPLLECNVVSWNSPLFSITDGLCFNIES